MGIEVKAGTPSAVATPPGVGRPAARGRWTMLGALLTLAGLLASAGCTLGPDFSRPEAGADAPAGWSAAASAAFADAASRPVPAPFDGRRWWAVFRDPLLEQLIAEAAAQNLDVQTAGLRIEQARLQRDAAGGAAYPQVAGTGVAGRSRMSEHGLAGVLGGGSSSSSSSASSSSPSLSSNFFQLGFDATWEIDLWGRVRRNVEAADAQIVSAEEARHDALASLSAEIARTYFALRGAERQLAITRADEATQRRVAELVVARRRVGLAAEADVSAQAAQLDAVRAQLPSLQQSAAQSRSRLALLLALPPGALDARLAAPRGDATTAGDAAALPPEVPVGLPGELLRRRPDVRRSEAELHAATARIGVATAALFPGITLGAAAGLQATRIGDLHDWGSRFALGGAEITIPIFQGGQLRAQVRLAGVAAREAAIGYRQAVLNAYHDADDALVAYGQAQQRADALVRQLGEARRSRELAFGRWQSGLAAFIDVLDAERTAHQAELRLAESRVAESTDLIALFKALGGGWNEDADGLGHAVVGSER